MPNPFQDGISFIPPSLPPSIPPKPVRVLKIVKVRSIAGTTMGITIPQRFAKDLGLGIGEQMLLVLDLDTRTITAGRADDVMNRLNRLNGLNGLNGADRAEI